MKKSTFKKEYLLVIIVAAISFTFFGVMHAATSLGLSSALATNIYYVLQGVSWASLAVSIVAGMGIGAAAGAAIFAAVKKMALKTFIRW